MDVQTKNRIGSNLPINKESIELYISVDIDGETVIDKKSDSLVSNFIKGLYGIMGGGKTLPSFNSVNAGDIGNDSAPVIASYDSTGSDVVITLGSSTTLTQSEDGNYYLQVSGVITNSGTELNGVWQVPETSGTTFTLIGSGNGGSYDVTNGFIIRVEQGITTHQPSDYIFGSPNIVLSTETATVEVDDWYINDQIKLSSSQVQSNTLEQGSLSLAQPVDDDTSSTFTLTQTFSNVTQETINIRKAGLYADVGGEYVLIASDLITADLDATETISINYKIVTSTTVDGGILNQFNQLLFTMMGGGDIPTTDVSNTLHTEWKSDEDNSFDIDQPFVCTTPNNVYDNFPPQLDLNITESEFLDAWNIGPILGTAAHSVDATDFALVDDTDTISEIASGEADGELIYYPSYVHSYSEDTGAGTAEFIVSRFVENTGTTNIDVNQIGLYTSVVSANTSGGGRPISEYRQFALSSDTIATTETIAAGEIYRIDITISVEV